MSEAATQRDFDLGECMFLQLDPCGKKIKPGPKSTAVQNLIKRTGGLKKTELKYADFVPLYNLWSGYFSQLLALSPRIDERLLKIDLHGCLLVVIDSLNPAQVGVHGIVLHESKQTFQLLTKKDKVAVIQKDGTTFQFVFEGRVFTLFGSALGQRSFARGKRFKGRLELPFFLPQSSSMSGNSA